jgi:rod shape-determining protein MreD
LFRQLGPFAVGMLWVFVTTTLLAFSPFLLPAPDIVLIVVIMVSFQYSLLLGGSLALVLGLVQDVLSGGVIGLNALTKTLIFVLSRWIVKRFYLPTMLFKIAMVVFGTLIDGMLVTVILLMGRMVHIPIAVFAQQLFVQMICTGLLAPLVIITTPQASGLDGSGEEERFFYGHTKARVRRI